VHWAENDGKKKWGGIFSAKKGSGYNFIALKTD
jgi:hypothetical protein